MSTSCLQVRIKGHWLTCHAPDWRFSGGEAPRAGAPGGAGARGEQGLASEVAFDGFGVRLQGVFGLDLGRMLPGESRPRGCWTGCGMGRLAAGGWRPPRAVALYEAAGLCC